MLQFSRKVYSPLPASSHAMRREIYKEELWDSWRETDKGVPSIDRITVKSESGQWICLSNAHPARFQHWHGPVWLCVYHVFFFWVCLAVVLPLTHHCILWQCVGLEKQTLWHLVYRVRDQDWICWRELHITQRSWILSCILWMDGAFGYLYWRNGKFALCRE